MAMAMVVKFCFETVTDLAFIPALGVMSTRGRHFELFMGIFQWYVILPITTRERERHC